MIVRALTLLLCLASPAFASEWQMDREASALTFSGTQSGTAFDGRFQTFDAEIRFDKNALADAVITVTIDTASAVTGSAERDSTLPGADWFNVADYPTATFHAMGVEETASGYVANGSLTLKGTEQPVALPFTLDIDGDTGHANGSVTINRTAFGVGTGALSAMVGTEVTISFELVAVR